MQETSAPHADPCRSDRKARVKHLPLKSVRARVVAAVIVIGLLVAALAWWKWRPEPPPALVTSPATVADIEQTVVATGTIEASKLVSVGAQVSGQIKVLAVELGQQVKTGDLIAEIDSTTQQNMERNAVAQVTTAMAQRASQLATLKGAELAFARQKQMLAAEATSRAEYESAEATLGSTRAQIKALDAQIEQAQTALDTATANLGYTRITAPMDGTVVAVVAKEGQTVNANQSTPNIVMLAKLDTVTVNADISEADVVKVKVGQPVYFTTLGDNDKRYYGELRTIEPAPQSITQEQGTSANAASSAVYYKALFDVPNPDGVLRISMTAQVYVVLAEAKDALTIPAAALGRRSRKDGTYEVEVVDAKGQASTRKITVGINNNAVAEVLSGLAEGEKVVVGEASDAPSDTQLNQQRRGGSMRRML
jgi:macrolide-specific efflux system membrane fusion protein